MENNGIMDKEELKKYVFDRRLHFDDRARASQLRKLKGIVVHNAERKEFVERMLKRAGVKYYEFSPRYSTEPHYFVQNTGEIHVVNTRGLTRLKRDEDLSSAINLILQKNIPFRIHHHGADPAKASQRFKDFAFDTVELSFKGLNLDYLKKQNNLYVMMGPHKSLNIDSTQIQQDVRDEYLNFRIFSYNGKQIIHFDYIFADQAKDILEQLYLHMDAKVPGTNLHLFHYGKVGGLKDYTDVGTVCVPTSAMDESEILQGNAVEYPINNQFNDAFDPHKIFHTHLDERIVLGPTVNSTSVLSQTYTGLEKLAAAGAGFIEMEWLLLANTMKSAYPHMGDVKFYAAGVVSDEPLKGKTLANTYFPKQKLAKVAQAQLAVIDSQPNVH